MKFVIGPLLTVLFFATGWAATPSLCTQTEKVYFSCVTTSAGRILSVCGSADLSDPDAYIQYRFGSASVPELEYPSHRADSFRSFRFYHYVRPLVSRTGITFQSGNFTYTVYDHYEGDTQPEQTFSGVSVSQIGTSKEADISCKGDVVNRLVDLEDVIPCDPENALSNCEQ